MEEEKSMESSSAIDKVRTWERILGVAFASLVTAAICNLARHVTAPRSPFLRTISEYFSLYPYATLGGTTLLVLVSYGSAEISIRWLRSHSASLEKFVSKARDPNYIITTFLVLSCCFCGWICVLALLLMSGIVDALPGIVILSSLSVAAIALFKLVATSQDFTGVTWLIFAQSIVVALVFLSRGGWFETFIALVPAPLAIYAIVTPGEKLYSHIARELTQELPCWFDTMAYGPEDMV